MAPKKVFQKDDRVREPSRGAGHDPIGLKGNQHSSTDRIAPSIHDPATLTQPSHSERRSNSGRGGRQRLPAGSPLPSVLQMAELKAWPFGTLERLQRRYGDVFTVRSPGMPPLVFLADHAAVREVFAAPEDVLWPGEGGAAIMPIVGERSFMLADGDEHRRGRSLLRSEFARATAERNEDVVRAIVERHVATWPRGTQIALQPLLRDLALRVVLHTIFGSGDDGVEVLHGKLLAMLSMTTGIVLAVPPARRMPPGRGTWKRFLQDRRDTDQLLYELIDARRMGRSEANGTIKVLLEARHEDAPLPAPYLRDTVMSVILAGHETTTAELAWAFELLGQHREVLEKLVHDLDRGSDAYLDATIREVLRHRPVFVFAIPRAVKQPIEVGGRTYEASAHLLPCIYLLQHDPRVHPQPYLFRPERFLAGTPESEVRPMAWGGGRKRCPGRHLAGLEMRIVLRAVLSQLTLRPMGRRVARATWRSVVVTPHPGSRVILEPR
jgi:cytochrome P450